MKPGVLAVRAINQYRRRDILAYVGLRYYLENSCAVSDRWIQEISTHLVNTRSSPAYYRSYHFKEIENDDSIVYRDIYVPGPNEILAETSLLNQCAAESAFRTSPHVYSYQLPEAKSKEGIYRSYFPGFQKRHRSINLACQDSDNYVVRYTDIRKFYPSISKQLALETWESTCESSNISLENRELGNKLLTNHSEIANADNVGAGILTGPMISHLIANLVLSKVDKIMSQKMDGRYWRYVDDVILVGNIKQVNNGRALLQSTLEDLGLELHDGEKDFEVGSSEWSQGANDFNSDSSTLWTSLIANIKRFLVARPEERIDLVNRFSENGINIPLLDYSIAVQEASSLEKFSNWLGKYHWAPKQVRSLTSDILLQNAVEARHFYYHQMINLLDTNINAQGYTRKRLIPKLRYYAGRLSYLGTPQMFTTIIENLNDFPELRLRLEVMTTIQSRDVSSILRFGANATQAATQILRISKEPVTCSLKSFNSIEHQGLAVLNLNGIKINASTKLDNKQNNGLLNQFASGENPLQLMKSDDPYIKELACLRGIENPLRHESMIDTAFDRDEQLTFDVINQLNDSS